MDDVTAYVDPKGNVSNQPAMPPIDIFPPDPNNRGPIIPPLGADRRGKPSPNGQYWINPGGQLIPMSGWRGGQLANDRYNLHSYVKDGSFDRQGALDKYHSTLAQLAQNPQYNGQQVNLFDLFNQGGEYTGPVNMAMINEINGGWYQPGEMGTFTGKKGNDYYWLGQPISEYQFRENFKTGVGGTNQPTQGYGAAPAPTPGVTAPAPGPGLNNLVGRTDWVGSAMNPAGGAGVTGAPGTGTAVAKPAAIPNPATSSLAAPAGSAGVRAPVTAGIAKPSTSMAKSAPASGEIFGRSTPQTAAGFASPGLADLTKPTRALNLGQGFNKGGRACKPKGYAEGGRVTARDRQIEEAEAAAAPAKAAKEAETRAEERKESNLDAQDKALLDKYRKKSLMERAKSLLPGFASGGRVHAKGVMAPKVRKHISTGPTDEEVAMKKGGRAKTGLAALIKD